MVYVLIMLCFHWMLAGPLLYFSLTGQRSGNLYHVATSYFQHSSYKPPLATEHLMFFKYKYTLIAHLKGLLQRII